MCFSPPTLNRVWLLFSNGRSVCFLPGIKSVACDSPWLLQAMGGLWLIGLGRAESIKKS